MTAFHHKLIVDEFRDHGGTLTGSQIAAVVGFGWRRDVWSSEARPVAREDPILRGFVAPGTKALRSFRLERVEGLTEPVIGWVKIAPLAFDVVMPSDMGAR